MRGDTPAVRVAEEIRPLDSELVHELRQPLGVAGHVPALGLLRRLAAAEAGQSGTMQSCPSASARASPSSVPELLPHPCSSKSGPPAPTRL